MKKILAVLSLVLFTQSACDLRPKIVAFPDSVGEFISARYPALLADPETQPEIQDPLIYEYS